MVVDRSLAFLSPSLLTATDVAQTASAGTEIAGSEVCHLEKNQDGTDEHHQPSQAQKGIAEIVKTSARQESNEEANRSAFDQSRESIHV